MKINIDSIRPIINPVPQPLTYLDYTGLDGHIVGGGHPNGITEL